ncbi:hypothetical protein [Nocardiopsis nanhaiensis]
MKFTGLTAIASVFTLAIVGVLGGPGIAGAATPTSTTEDSGNPEGIDLSEIPDEGAEALDCYAGGHEWTTSESSSRYVPAGWPAGEWFTTTGICNDINVIIDNSTPSYVWVCFNPSSGDPYCQDDIDRTYVRSSIWTVVATDVAPGTQFKLRFDHSSDVAGRVAS